jgi:CBS domain-containing protein
MFASHTIEQLMTRNVVTLESSEPVRKAIREMVQKDIGNVVVVERGKPVGILTERDVMKLSAEGKDVLTTRVSDVMSGRPLITVTPEINALEALLIMHRNKIRRLPVTQSGKLLGIVTENDLVHWVIEAAYAPSSPPF